MRDGRRQGGKDWDRAGPPQPAAHWLTPGMQPAQPRCKTLLRSPRVPGGEAEGPAPNLVSWSAEQWSFEVQSNLGQAWPQFPHQG